MNGERITVITVCRNCAAQLARTMQSVAEQTYGGIEYVVIDGASTDESVELIRQSVRVDKWVSEPDRGIYDAMNKGVSMASGQWMIFMNAGDTFAAPDTVARMMEAARPDDDVLYGGVIKKNREGVAVTYPVPPVRDSHRMIFCHQSVMCRRELLESHPFDINHRMSADFKFFKILIREHRAFHRVDFPIAIFDTGGVSNRRRSLGLEDNMKVIMEVDGPLRGAKHLLHLLPTYLMLKIRGK
ncbi:MAG: glycosyltransferase [Muribaculaceae bacterium]|nr:glycosyltransferase [Muribaculaceae bacterium]